MARPLNTKSRVRLNPYMTAAGLILTRLRWDMTPLSWISRSRLRKLRDAYRGQKAVILCNGPSLLNTDWPLLRGIYTFGLNKINLLFETQQFRPSCIVAVNPFVLRQNADFYNSTNIPLFLDSYAIPAGIGFRKNVIFLHSANIHKFASDCSMSVNQGGTVTFVAMQLAFHMGFSDVAVVGCDHSFHTQGLPNDVCRIHSSDHDHFHPDYFTAGSQWQLPDLPLSEASYSLARTHFHSAGRRLVNATHGGQLDALPRSTLPEFLCSTCP